MTQGMGSEAGHGPLSLTAYIELKLKQRQLGISRRRRRHICSPHRKMWEWFSQYFKPLKMATYNCMSPFSMAFQNSPDPSHS